MKILLYLNLSLLCLSNQYASAATMLYKNSTDNVTKCFNEDINSQNTNSITKLAKELGDKIYADYTKSQEPSHSHIINDWNVYWAASGIKLHMQNKSDGSFYFRGRGFTYTLSDASAYNEKTEFRISISISEKEEKEHAKICGPSLAEVLTLGEGTYGVDWSPRPCISPSSWFDFSRPETRGYTVLAYIYPNGDESKYKEVVYELETDLVLPHVNFSGGKTINQVVKANPNTGKLSVIKDGDDVLTNVIVDSGSSGEIKFSTPSISPLDDPDYKQKEFAINVNFDSITQCLQSHLRND